MIRLKVTCRECGTATEHRVGAVFVDHESRGGDDDAAAWTRAVYVPVSLTCPSCGAVDAHDVVPESARRLQVDGEVVREGRVALSDGTVIHNPSEGIARLTERAEASPTEAIAWRALGNFAMRAGRDDEALAAWRRGADLEGEFECALAVAVDAVARAAPDAGAQVERAAERLVHTQAERRPLQSAHVAELARKWAHLPTHTEGRSDSMVIRIDGRPIEVLHVKDWSAFGEALAGARTVECGPPAPA